MVWPLNFSVDTSSRAVLAIQCDGTAGLLGIEIHCLNLTAPDDVMVVLTRTENVTDVYWHPSATPSVEPSTAREGYAQPVEMDLERVILSQRAVHAALRFVDHHGVEVAVRLDASQGATGARSFQRAHRADGYPALSGTYDLSFQRLNARSITYEVTYGGRSVVKDTSSRRGSRAAFAPSPVTIGLERMRVDFLSPDLPAVTAADPGVVTDSHGYLHSIVLGAKGRQAVALFTPPLFQVGEVTHPVHHRWEITCERDQVASGHLEMTPLGEDRVRVELSVESGWTGPAPSAVSRLRSTVTGLLQGHTTWMEQLHYSGECSTEPESLSGRWIKRSS